MPEDDLALPEEQGSELSPLEHDDEPADELRNSSESLDSGWETDLEIQGKVTWSMVGAFSRLEYWTRLENYFTGKTRDSFETDEKNMTTPSH